MIRVLTVAAATLLLATVTPPLRADVLIVIDKAKQEMRVISDGTLAHAFKTSTGMYGTGTPIGSYPVERLHRYWFSRKYDNAPMPYAIFFHGPYAIHGTTVISRLGNPASHGCVRLHPKDAAVLFALVQREGKDNTTVIVTGSNPPRPVVRPEVSSRQRERALAPRRVVSTYVLPLAW